MSGPINIKGVTDGGFIRNFGGGAQSANNRFLTSTGYGQVLKKIFKINDLRKIKENFKAAGLETNRFSTFKKIKENDFLKDLKEADKVGIVKDLEIARNKFKGMQKQEELDLRRKEESIFNNLNKAAKHKLVWGRGNNIKSIGAKIAAELQRKRDQDLRKTGDEGIHSFRTLEKLGDRTLWERYKLLRDAPHKNATAIRKLREISSDINLIKLKAKKDSSILHRYGIPEMQQEKGALDKSKVHPPSASRRSGQKLEVEGETPKTKSQSSKWNVSISQSSSGGLAATGEANRREAPALPFTVVGGFKNFTEKVEPSLERVVVENIALNEKSQENIRRAISTQERQYGFINQAGGAVESDTAKEDVDVIKKDKKAA